ncbi:Zinc finger BED domain-containing protein 4 [Eumeta japonica]|uniref:Zinc finger BED domain-containing protein 4 n=1 Tax=Eumeta variegata TaxID=151549 RepID=A0A4C1U276_EUMVA|nr:Zinc finger BED domain-containing protein 4 [Eumeta japonica]
MKPDTSQQFRNLTRRLRDELNSSARFGELTKDDKYTVATYLDPRYKSYFFSSITTEQVEVKILNMTISRTRQSRELTNSTYDDSVSCVVYPKRRRTQIEDEVQPTSSSMMNSSFQLLESMLSTNEDQEISTTTNERDNLLLEIQSHFQEYKKEKRLNEDPLVWWKLNSHKYRNLLPLVRQYLSVPSSVASEQLFSEAGLIYVEHRKRLLGVKAAKLLFIKYNLPLLNFKY